MINSLSLFVIHLLTIQGLHCIFFHERCLANLAVDGCPDCSSNAQLFEETPHHIDECLLRDSRNILLFIFWQPAEIGIS